MCGIAGWYRRNGRPVAREIVVRQCDAIRHRGPDDAGYFADGDFAMGMRRLSIIDIAQGQQPITSNCGRYRIVFNGEIYNHRELRMELEQLGYRFETQSDTEVLLAAWLHWRESAWLRLDGMYAVAIWDGLARELLLVRDPLGIKPLYLTQQNGGLAFGSELSTLTVLPEHDFDVSERAVYDFFRFGQIEPPNAIYRQVRSLPPGHMLRLGRDGDAREERFWKPQIGQAPRMSERDWIEEARSRLLETVRSHMVADVPVGVFLSGGVDSSAVAAAMARQSSGPVTAFTIGLPGNVMDEANAAQRTARHLGCNHQVLPIDLDQARDAVPAIQAGFDEPLGTRGGVILSWYLSKFAAGHVKAVLCGDGGDELFAGYKRQRNALRMERWQTALALLSRLARNGAENHMGRGVLGKLLESAALENGFQRMIAGTQVSTTAQRRRLLSPAFLERQERAIAQLEKEWFDDPDWRDATMLEQFMLGDILVHMPGGPLARLDRTSMAHSLEARVPLLSHRFVEWSLTVPAALKARAPGKYILREAIRPWLPEGILERRKQGFQIPLKDWFRGDFARFGREVWHESGFADAGYLNSTEVDRLFDAHLSGQENNAKQLYALTTFCCWWMQHA